MKVFFLEDDDAIGMGLTYSLEKEGYAVTHVKTCKEARSEWASDKCDIAILDINLPDGNGYDICKMIKEKCNVPVIFLTASDAEVNVVMGLEMGADDYICKPFRVNELMARIRAVLRRSGNVNDNAQGDFANGNGAQGGNAQNGNFASNIIKIADITIYTNEAKVTRFNSDTNAEESIELTALEYRLLLAFCNNRGIVLSRKNLLEDMWDVSGDFVNGNTLTVYKKASRQDRKRPRKSAYHQNSPWARLHYDVSQLFSLKNFISFVVFNAIFIAIVIK